MGRSNQWGVDLTDFFVDTAQARLGRLILGLRDSTVLSVTQQSDLCGVSLLEYWSILELMLEWLDHHDDLRGQSDRLTDVRLSEVIPHSKVRVVCRRCGVKLQSVPCIECLLEGGESKPIKRNYPVLDNLPSMLLDPKVDKLPPWATSAEPGSTERIAVYRWRAERRFILHHPADEVLPDFHLLD